MSGMNLLLPLWVDACFRAVSPLFWGSHVAVAEDAHDIPLVTNAPELKELSRSSAISSTDPVQPQWQQVLAAVFAVDVNPEDTGRQRRCGWHQRARQFQDKTVGI